MSEVNQGNYTASNDLEQARQLRIQAEILEHRERVRGRLKQLIAISQDIYYDQYLAQLMKDLESGKATPAQVEREAERSYGQYQQRVAKGLIQKPQPRNSAAIQEAAVQSEFQKGYEFKIGAHVFSLVGAVFVLAAFILFGFHFLTGIWQGLCLYIAALILVLISELLLRRKSLAFSNVITGIGIGGLYIANIINYLVLKNINGIVAMLLTVFIAVGTILLSRKKDSAAIRIISLLGCYICFFPVKGFETALSFLVVAVMLFVINVISIFLQNRKNQAAINSFHIMLNAVFTAIITGIAWWDKIDAVYLIVYVVTSFIFIHILCLKQCRKEKSPLFVFTCLGNGICIFLVFLIGNLGPGLDGNNLKMLYVQMVAEVLVLMISVIAFLLWEKADRRRWNHVYYPALLMLLLESEYHLDVVITTMLVLFAVKILAKNRELLVLDCIVTVWAALTGLAFQPLYGWGMELPKDPVLSSYACLCIFTIGMLVSIAFIRPSGLYLYHEIVITLYMVWASSDLLDKWEVADGWYYITYAAELFLLFLLFNHLPKLKGKSQLPYNIVSICIMALVYLVSCRENWIVTSVMMVLGSVVILVIFRKRYQLGVPRKHLILAGFLTVFAFAGDYGSPVITSILLMIIALSCVGIGFKQQDKAERICGLVMAIFVCIKLVLFDFREVNTMYRILVFLVVGILTLGISFIYIQLEKNMEKKERQRRAENKSKN